MTDSRIASMELTFLLGTTMAQAAHEALTLEIELKQHGIPVYFNYGGKKHRASVEVTEVSR